MNRRNRLLAVIRKEAIQTLRDWPTLLMVLIMPVLEMVLFAYVGDMTLEHLPTAVADLSMDTRSRAFISALEVSESFDMALYLSSEADVIRAIDDGVVAAGVVIPPDFGAQIERGDAQALIILDGSDPFTVQSGYAAASAIAQSHAAELMLETTERMGMTDFGVLPITTSTRILYNPNSDDLIFLVPGIAAVVLQTMAVTMSAVSVVRERELGTIEQLLITPVRPWELIVGKMAPAIVVTTIDLLLVMAVGILYFKVPFQGSIGLFALLSLVFIISGLGLGLMLSTVAQNQRQAQQLTSVMMMLTMLLTGLIYPRSTMPPAVRAIGNLIPATYFMRIARGIVTKGIGMEFLWSDVGVLALYSLVVVVIAASTFRQRLD